MIAANANAEMIEAGRGREEGPIESRYHRPHARLFILKILIPSLGSD